MDSERLKELAGINEDLPGYGNKYGKERSKDSRVIDMVLSNLRTMKIALEQNNMQGVQEELNKAMTMLARAQTQK